MHIDVPTLYNLLVGTLSVAVAMTVWELFAHPGRAGVLGFWAAGYAVLAVSCFLMFYWSQFPGHMGQALTNILSISGYFLIAHGVARFDGRGKPAFMAGVVVVLSLVWLSLGVSHPLIVWLYVGSFAVAVANGAIAWMLFVSRAVRRLRSRPLAISIAGGHALFYLGRALVMPVLRAIHGPEASEIATMLTMLEGALFSVAMPMALLTLVREETQNQLRDALRTDHLTGLGNRHALFDEGPSILRQVDRPLSLLAFDLDHFKTINDRHGHAVGDAVLKLFAQVARDVAGPQAIIARLGGEEFAALLPGRDAQGARTIAETICIRFSSESASPNGLAVQATVSIGLAEAAGDRHDLPTLLSAADRALYEAKARGRNRVEIAAPGLMAA